MDSRKEELVTLSGEQADEELSCNNEDDGARNASHRDAAKSPQPLVKEDFVLTTEAALEGLFDLDPIAEIAVPVLLIRGEAEMALVADAMQVWAERDATAALSVIEGAGHLPHNDNPRAFNRALLAFLQRI